MTLFLLRHAIAEDERPGGTDRDRRLTPRGRTRMRRASAGLRRLTGELDAIYTSPYPRAAETAAIVAADHARAARVRELEALVPGTSPVETVRALREIGEGARVMLVGHEPGLSSVAALLLSGSVEGCRLVLKKGGCIALALQAPAPRAATLQWLATPRMLRRLGRP